MGGPMMSPHMRGGQGGGHGGGGRNGTFCVKWGVCALGPSPNSSGIQAQRTAVTSTGVDNTPCAWLVFL